MSTDLILTALNSIDATLKELLALSKQRKSAPAAAPTVADDADLDSEHGDELVKFKPKNWTGDFMKGQRMSESAPAFLDMLADSFAYFAKRNDENGAKADNGTPKSTYDRRSERRARDWSARLKAGWVAKAPAGMATKDDITW